MATIFSVLIVLLKWEKSYTKDGDYLMRQQANKCLYNLEMNALPVEATLLPKRCTPTSLIFDVQDGIGVYRLMVTCDGKVDFLNGKRFLARKVFAKNLTNTLFSECDGSFFER